MTTYTLASEIYAQELRRLITCSSEVPSVLTEIREVRRQARQERARSREPGFLPPYVSYIPAYGHKERMRAMIDYCRLKPTLDRSVQLAQFVSDSLTCPMRSLCRSRSDSSDFDGLEI
jgi:hypothetical protein